MRLITAPKLIVATTSAVLIDQPLKQYLVGRMDSDLGFSLDLIPEIAGRTCYQSFSKPRPGGQGEYLNNILQSGHGSVLEHASVGFIITGVSRSLTHEFVRHRAGFAYSELSQRYYEPEEPAFVLPPLALENPAMRNALEDGFANVFSEYQALVVIGTKYESEKWQAENPNDQPTRKDLTLIRKRARESARAMLPNATETHIFATGNLRAWRHFVELRGSIHADLEIRRLAVMIAKQLKASAPNVFQDISTMRDADGRESVFACYTKV